MRAFKGDRVEVGIANLYGQVVSCRTGVVIRCYSPDGMHPTYYDVKLDGDPEASLAVAEAVRVLSPLERLAEAAE